jgi:hypothetical protein
MSVCVRERERERESSCANQKKSGSYCNDMNNKGMIIVLFPLPLFLPKIKCRKHKLHTFSNYLNRKQKYFVSANDRKNINYCSVSKKENYCDAIGLISLSKK